MAINLRKIGMGIVAASVGAAAFGAIHFMFLAPNYAVGDFFGIPLTVLLPFVLGAVGFAVSFYPKITGTLKDVVTYGSAAAIGFGIAQYAGWTTTPVVLARARVRMPVRIAPTVAPPLAIRPPVTMI